MIGKETRHWDREWLSAISGISDARMVMLIQAEFRHDACANLCGRDSGLAAQPLSMSWR